MQHSLLHCLSTLNLYRKGFFFTLLDIKRISDFNTFINLLFTPGKSHQASSIDLAQTFSHNSLLTQVQCTNVCEHWRTKCNKMQIIAGSQIEIDHVEFFICSTVYTIIQNAILFIRTIYITQRPCIELHCSYALSMQCPQCVYGMYVNCPHILFNTDSLSF